MKETSRLRVDASNVAYYTDKIRPPESAHLSALMTAIGSYNSSLWEILCLCSALLSGFVCHWTHCIRVCAWLQYITNLKKNCGINSYLERPTCADGQLQPRHVVDFYEEEEKE
jgi:hypothetical protein